MLTEPVRHVRVAPVHDRGVEVIVAGDLRYAVPGARATGRVAALVGESVHGVGFHPFVLADSASICKEVEWPGRRSM